MGATTTNLSALSVDSKTIKPETRDKGGSTAERGSSLNLTQPFKDKSKTNLEKLIFYKNNCAPS